MEKDKNYKDLKDLFEERKRIVSDILKLGEEVLLECEKKLINKKITEYKMSSKNVW